MPMIAFVIHRAQDYEAGVSIVTRVLGTLLGPSNVLVDRYSFLPGSSWLPQLRAQVASADIVVCVVGPAWASDRRPSLATDYVAEELAIARQLRKPVVPVLIGDSRTQLAGLIPPQLKWLLSVQFLMLNPAEADEAFLARLRQVLPASSEAETEPGFKLWSLALTRLSQSMLAPVRSAAASFHPSVRTLWSGAVQLCLASLLLGVAATLAVERLDAVSVVRGGFLSLVSVIVLAAWFRVFSWLARSPVSTIGLFGFATYLTAALFAATSLWTAAFSAAIPEEVRAELIRRVAAEAPLESLSGWDPGLEGIQFLATTAVNWLCGFHLLFILWGYSRAASMVLGWRHWIALVLISLPTATLVAAVLFIIYMSATSSSISS